MAPPTHLIAASAGSTFLTGLSRTDTLQVGDHVLNVGGTIPADTRVVAIAGTMATLNSELQCGIDHSALPFAHSHRYEHGGGLMAALTSVRRNELWREFMSELSGMRVTTGTLTKSDISAAANALDQWFNDNAATLNTALPQPFRGAASPTLKALLMLFVIRYRYLDGA